MIGWDQNGSGRSWKYDMIWHNMAQHTTQHEGSNAAPASRRKRPRVASGAGSWGSSGAGAGAYTTKTEDRRQKSAMRLLDKPTRLPTRNGYKTALQDRVIIHCPTRRADYKTYPDFLLQGYSI